MILKRLEMTALKINKNFFNYSILDAGYRTMDFKPFL